MLWHGRIGYSKPEAVSPHVTEMVVRELEACGHIETYKIRNESSQSQNGSIRLQMVIRATVPPPVFDLVPYISYASHLGHLWKVEDAAPDPPEIVLTLGGVYNGNKPDTGNQNG